MKLLISLIILFFVSNLYQANAWYQDIDSKTKLVYENFYSKIKVKHKNDNWLSFLKILDTALESSKYNWKIDNNNSKLFFDLQKLNNEKIFILELENKEKINKQKIEKYSIFNNYNLFSYNNDLLIKENWVWYTYTFSKKYYFENVENLNKESLIYNWLYDKNIIIYHDGTNVNFIKEYKKVKLVSDDIIYWFPDKYELLKNIRNNKMLDNSRDDDIYIKNLEIISRQLTKDIYKEEEKIKIIYDYILKNISYSSNFTMQDYEIFSWIETYINKSWVCEWYVELFNLMLWFNNIKSEIVIWDVIDAADFPQIWHAWVKIWDYYYDITFDDPVWAEKTKKYEEYDYFKLPRDLFYTNRYDKWLTPESLKTETLEYRKNLIKTNLSKLTTKYKNNNYNLLKSFKFKENYNLDPIKKIKANDLISTIGYKEMKNYEIIINWEKKSVKNLNYIILEDDTIEVFLEQINYNLDWYMILKWFKDNWETQFIIANNITYHN